MNLALVPDALETQEAPASANLQDYLRILLRYKWGIVALALLGALAGALKAYTDTPQYQASSLMLIERQSARFVPIDAVYQATGEGYYDFGEYYETQYEILKSRPIAARVVEEVGLDAFDRRVDERGFSFAKLLGESSAAPPQRSEEQRRERAIGIVTGSIRINPIKNSQLVRIVFVGPDKHLITALANALPKAYIEETLEGRTQMTEMASTWLTDRLSTLRKRLEDSEKALQEFRDRERLIDVKGVDSLATQEVELATSRLAAAKRERLDKQVGWQQVRDARAAGRPLDTIPALLSYPLVSELKGALVAAERRQREASQKYGPKHPVMVEATAAVETARAALDRQLEQAADSIEKDYEVARQRESQVGGELGAAKGEIRDINRKEYELQRLTREVAANQQLYDQFQTRVKETAAATGVQIANARMIEGALVPGAPFLPNKPQMITVGLLLGLALGVGLAFLLEHLDNTLKGAEDVEQRLQIPVLGLLPRLQTSGKGDHTPLRQFAEAPKSSFSEAVRTVRTSVLLSAIDEKNKRLLVTSSVPGEGKTTLSMNLAHAIGQMRRVLLIDADMRRPAVHRGIPTEGEAKGLSQFVVGDATLAECMHQIQGTNVFVMRAGPVPPNPQELLSSKRFEDALMKLSDSFDHVIIDCAPACAVSDALILSKLVHGVIYVVRSDSTPYQLAEQGIKRLRRVDAPIVGAVVNHVVPRKNRYGYGYYGKYYYHGDSYYSDYGYGAAKKA